MEFLKMNPVYSIIFVLLFSSFIGYAQDFDALKEAYAASYEQENNGKYADAIKTLKSVYNKEDYINNLRLGWLSYQNGDFTGSVAYYERAIQLKPYSIEPRFGLAYPASAMGNWNIVISQYNKILEIDPQNTMALYKLGMINYSNEKYEEAFKHFEKIVNLYPFDYDSLIMFAWTNLKLGKTREAEVLFKQCMLYYPEDESATQGLNLIR